MISFLNRILGIMRPAASPANDEDDLIEDLREKVHRDVASGLYGWSEIVTRAQDYFGARIDTDNLRSAMRLAFEQASAAQGAKQTRWPRVTDCDRLDAAFAQLEATGVIARHDFQCCQSCAGYAMWNEAEAFAAAGGTLRGHVFYHEQDTDSALDGDGLYLAYGAAEEGDEAAAAIGREIVGCLQRHGLETQWNGEVLQRIHVALDWKRRWVGTIPNPERRQDFDGAA